MRREVPFLARLTASNKRAMSACLLSRVQCTSRAAVVAVAATQFGLGKIGSSEITTASCSGQSDIDYPPVRAPRGRRGSRQQRTPLQCARGTKPEACARPHPRGHATASRPLPASLRSGPRPPHPQVFLPGLEGLRPPPVVRDWSGWHARSLARRQSVVRWGGSKDRPFAEWALGL